MGIALAALSGLALGSFLNVVIARLPAGESLMRPASRCPHCGHPVRPWDNVPVVSWLLLRGRCRDCGAPISARYPLVEALTAGLFVAVVLVKGADEDALLGLALVLTLVPVTFIDLDHRLILNRILLPSAVAAIAILAATDPGELPEHLIAGVAAGGFFLLAAVAYPSGMGMGDVKLAGTLGLYLGLEVAPALLAALLSGTLVGAGIMARRGAAEGRKTAVPFGPFLALGALVGLFVGPEILDWYRDTFL
ncbi:MAG: leader peptidase (prepilin peptidase) / N-methyltransferase [Solirubrobacteraceae bacterium]|jgi:leader peptidase (prepilin peptidase)/N-methyltransferase|nr:leader peptidase (prepilin peptidase) / N-methyltransferase [Solirubrobacteraceae bacterium]